MYRVFNMGIGMVAVVAPQDAGRRLQAAAIGRTLGHDWRAWSQATGVRLV